MSRDRPSRRERANELLERLERGPASIGEPRTGKECEESYHLWANTWIIPEVKALIPQLQKKEPKEPKEPTE